MSLCFPPLGYEDKKELKVNDRLTGRHFEGLARQCI